MERNINTGIQECQICLSEEISKNFLQCENCLKKFCSKCLEKSSKI
jgi:hypothetical protein